MSMERTLNPLKSAVTQLRRNRKLLAGLIGFLTILLVSLSVYPFGITLPHKIGTDQPKLPPSFEHLLGTDDYGRDMLTIFLYAVQFSLYTGLVAGTIGTLIGATLGFISGYEGGVVDELLRNFIDMFMVVPLWPILAVVLVYLRGTSFTTIAILLGAFSWPGAARTIRSQVLTLKEKDFVDLAKISGLNQFEILFKEILPNMIPYLSLIFMGSVVGAMFAEVSLEVIGLVPKGNSWTLGLMFNAAIENIAVLKGWWWWVVPPTAALVGTFISLYTITVGLDEIANPRLKRITGM